MTEIRNYNILAFNMKYISIYSHEILETHIKKKQVYLLYYLRINEINLILLYYLLTTLVFTKIKLKHYKTFVIVIYI